MWVKMNERVKMTFFGHSTLYLPLLEIQIDQIKGVLVAPKISTEVKGVSKRPFVQISGEQL